MTRKSTAEGCHKDDTFEKREEELQRRLKALFDSIEKGKVKFVAEKVPQTMKALKSVRRKADGSFDLSTVESPVRALCNMVDVFEASSIIQDRKLSLALPLIKLPKLKTDRSSDDDFMRDLIEASNIVRKYLILVAALVPAKSIKRDECAILMGHMVRLYKLYDSMGFLIIERRGEVAMTLIRSLIETVINLRFMLSYGNNNLYKKYKKASLAYEKRLWEEIEKRRKTPPLPIEQRMQDSIQETFERAGLKIEDVVWEDRFWGGDIFSKADKVGLTELYEFGFRIFSHNIHGTWHDLEFHHLREKDGTFEPDFDYTMPVPQIVESTTIVCVDVAKEYVIRIVGDSGKELCHNLNELSDWFRKMAQLHEIFITGQNKRNDPQGM